MARPPSGWRKCWGSTKEAEKYIRGYFERYSGVHRWLDATIADVRRTGVSINLFGRRRPILDMNSRNPNARGFAERTAVNTPLQGTAADLIKLAMIRIEKTLAGMQTKMLLQVHDELVFEAPNVTTDAALQTMGVFPSGGQPISYRFLCWPRFTGQCLAWRVVTSPCAQSADASRYGWRFHRPCRKYRRRRLH